MLLRFAIEPNRVVMEQGPIEVLTGFPFHYGQPLLIAVDEPPAAIPEPDDHEADGDDELPEESAGA